MTKNNFFKKQETIKTIFTMFPFKFYYQRYMGDII